MHYYLLFLLVFGSITMNVSVSRESQLIIDDRSQSTRMSNVGTIWRGFSDRVMGGISAEHVSLEDIQERRCIRLTGEVKLENNGGFIQMALDLSSDGFLDASAYHGVRLLVRGNGEIYGAHLRTVDTKLPWQSYRATFVAEDSWREIHLPFTEFLPYRLKASLDTRRLRRLGVVAIGRAFYADVCVAEIGLYR